MSSTVNIGTLEGLLRWKTDDAELNKSLDSVAKKADVSRSQLNKYNKELASVTSSYARVVAAIDPVAANTQKYEKAERSLVAALKAGIITQDQHNRTLAQAKEKYLSIHASTSTWREEMQRLTNVISPFGSKLSNVTSLLDNVIGSFAGAAKGAEAAAVGGTAATTSFAAMATALAPLLPLLAALAIAFGGIYVGVKAVSFLNDAISEGVSTQLIIERLNNTLKSTGAYAQLSSAQLVVLAESYELLSGKSKEEIIAAETVLARFQTLNSTVYPQALSATLAYAKAMSVTAEQAASKLGPALEGNTRALGALKEAGIVLSQGQKKTLQDMIEGGRVAEYQAKLFEILKQKVGELSNEYDNNLSRQGERAKIVLQDFGESIANEVIPAVEDLVQGLVDSLGGWDALKAKVNEVGGAIGNFIRTSLYGLVIAYHDVMASIDIFIARHNLLLRVLATPLKLFTGGQDLIKSQREATKDATTHAQAIAALTNQFNEHRKALEGTTEVYQSHGSAVDDIISKNAELGRLTEELTDIYQQNELELERIFALRMLATKGPLGRETRLAEEKAINQAYKDRIEFLKLEEKFGTAVAKSLMEVKEQLRDFEIKAKIELELATKLSPIDLKPFIDKMFGRLVIDTKQLDSVIAIEEKNREEFRKSQEAYEQWVNEIANGWIEAFRPLRDIAEGEIAGVREAVKAGLLSVVEGEQAIAQIRSDLIASEISFQMDKWSSLFSFIGSQFGGVAQRISNAIQSIQASYQQGASIGSKFSGVGAAAGGAAGAIIGIWVAAYDWFKTKTAKDRAESYGYGAVIGRNQTPGGGTNWMTPQLGETRRASLQIQATLEALADAIGGVFSTFANLSVQIRRDGKYFRSYIEGELVGSFSDMQSAVEAAILKGLQSPSTYLSGVSDLVREGLTWALSDGVVKVGTLDELQGLLTTLKNISDLSLSQQVIDLQKTMLEFNHMREVLNKLDQSNESVIKSQKELADAQIRSIERVKNSYIGVDSSITDALRDLHGFQEGMKGVADSARSGIQSTIDAIKGQIKDLENTANTNRRGEGGAGVGSGSGTGIGPILKLFSDEIDDEKAKLQKSLDEWTKKLAEVPGALDEQEMNMAIFDILSKDLKDSAKYAGMAAEIERERIKRKYEEIRLQLVTMGLWDRWKEMWQDAMNSAMGAVGKMAGKGGGGHGNSDKQSVKDFIADKKFELSLVGLTDYQKSLKELDKQYDDLIKQAGKDKKLKKELMDLKEQELKLLAREAAADTRNKFREFMGLVTPFDKVRKTAADLIKEIQGSPLGSAEKANKVARVLSEIERQVKRLSDEMTVSLFGQMLNDMQQFGATDAEMSRARVAMAILEHELKMAGYAQTIAQLELEGKISADNLAILREQYAFLAGIDPSKFIGNNGGFGPIANDNFSGYSGSNIFDEFEETLKRVQDKLAEWNRLPLSDNLAKAHEMTDSFNALMADVEKLLPMGWDYRQIANDTFRHVVKDFIDDTLGEFEESGNELEDQLKAIGEQFTDINAAFVHLGASQEDLARAEQARLNSVSRALSQYLDPIRERRQSRLVGDRSILTGEQQYYNAQAQFRDMLTKIQGGDLTGLGDAVRLADQYEELLRSYTGGEGLRFGLKEIDDTLAAIESLVPGFASQMADVGTESNPMFTNNQDMVNALESNRDAVNNGNVLMLEEMRTSVKEMKTQTTKLGAIEDLLSNPLSVALIA